MKPLTEKQAWLALAETIYGYERLPPCVTLYNYHIDFPYTRVKPDEHYPSVVVHSIGLCTAVQDMEKDGVITQQVRDRMLDDIADALQAFNKSLRAKYGYADYHTPYICEFVGGEDMWEPRVDFCLVMAGMGR